MQTERSARSGASKQHSGGASKDGEVLSTIERADRDWGRDFKRYVRAAAALREIYDDTALGDAVGRSRAAVGSWWHGARPEAGTIGALAEVTGWPLDELTRFVHYGGSPPTFPEPNSPAAASVGEGLRQDRLDPQSAAHDTPATSPGRRPRGSGAGRG